MTEYEKILKERDLIESYAGDHHNLRPALRNMQDPNFTPNTISEVNNMAHRLINRGGLTQQERMIRDKRKTLDKAVLYSYQGAFVKKYYPDYVELMDGVRESAPVRALINPDKNKQDYDDKIISTGYENDFQPGDVFEWIGTGTYWLVVLQELTELAYFRGEIRRCCYQIAWKNENGELRSTYAAVRGPVETKINYIQKHGISVDEPNYSLHILMPLNADTKKEFRRYSKFYLQRDDVCWRVEAVDWISTPGILEVTAVEYYANEETDDIANGIAGGLLVEHASPNSWAVEQLIEGETFIKPKKTYTYRFTGNDCGFWSVDAKYPVEWTVNQSNPREVSIKWTSTYSGQFDLFNDNCRKTIVVESLF